MSAKVRLTIVSVVATAVALAGLGSASARHGVTRGSPANAPAADGFVRTIDNKYLPLKPGTVLRYKGTKDGQPSDVNYAVTDKTKKILGVRCVVVHDTLSINGHPEERTTDWFAQDTRGNVWYFGEDSFDLVNGTWVRSDGSWQAGVDGAQQGIVMEATPRVGDTYRQEYYAGHAEDMAQVLSTDASVTVPAGRFVGAVKTRDWTPLEPSVAEHKYYAPGVGEVRSVMVKGGTDQESLVSVQHDD
jgi:hypothetical protein